MITSVSFLYIKYLYGTDTTVPRKKSIALWGNPVNETICELICTKVVFRRLITPNKEGGVPGTSKEVHGFFIGIAGKFGNDF